MIAFLFNLIALFKEKPLNDHRLMNERLRIEIFSVGADLGMRGERSILRVGLKNKR